MNRIMAGMLGAALLGTGGIAAGQTSTPASTATQTPAQGVQVSPYAGTTETQARSRLADQFYVPGFYEPKPDGGYTWKEGFWANRQKDWRWIPSGWVLRPTGWTFRHGYWVSTLPRSSMGGTPGPVADVRSVTEVRPAPGGYAVPVAGAGVPGTDPTVAGASPSTYRTDLPPGTQFQDVTQIPPPSASQGGTRAPAPTYYIGNSLPGTSYSSVATQPAGIPGQSTYVGNSLPGTSYPSLATQPAAGVGQSYYIGNSMPGTSYPSLVGPGTSVGGYGYGNSAPGSTGGQIGGTGP